MAYNTAVAVPQQWFYSGVGIAPKIWRYASADTAATVAVSGYFTDGYARGMRDGDICYVYVTGTKVYTAHTVLNTSGQTIDLADGVATTTTANAG